MRIKHEEIEIVAGSPFDNCKLDRKKYASVLTSLIENYEEGFVLAINNKWGTGKTTFLKMWNQDLKDKEFQTIYFNAWENDFENSPLTAVMGELKSLKTEKTKEQFASAVEKAAKISKHLAPTIVKALAEKYINIESLNQGLADITEGLVDVFENDVKQYSERKKGIQEFKKSLSTFVANTSNGKSLVFMIDELDRCRPDYSVSLLEQIKHFFTVPNIVFVLSIDKKQLGNAIRGVYGSENLDYEEYLRRFIDIEYSLPEPESNSFYNYLYGFFEFDEFFESADRKQYRQLASDKNNFLSICSVLFANNQITLRQQEKIFSHSRIALRAFANNSFVIPSLYLFLVFLKNIEQDLYNRINQKEISIELLQDEFLRIVSGSISEDTEREILWLEAYLVNSYNIYLNYPYFRNKLYKYESGNNVLVIKSVVDKSEDGANFLHALESISRYDQIGEVSIGHLLKKINLMESFKFS